MPAGPIPYTVFGHDGGQLMLVTHSLSSSLNLGQSLKFTDSMFLGKFILPIVCEQLVNKLHKLHNLILNISLNISIKSLDSRVTGLSICV